MVHIHCISKKAYYSFVFVLCFCLLGCIGPEDFTVDSTFQSESFFENVTRFPDYEFDPESSLEHTRSCAASCEAGYYLSINNILHFYDVQSDTLFPLCTKESCRHIDETCDAYIFDWTSSSISYGKTTNGWCANAVDYKIYYNNDRLYMISAHPDNGLVLFQYSQYFTEQREIVWLEDYQNEPKTMYEHGTLLFFQGYIYYITYLFDAEKAWGNTEYRTIYTVWKAKLEEKAKPEKLFSFDCLFKQFNNFRIGAANDKVYFIIEYESMLYTSDGESKELNQQVTEAIGEVYSYDDKEGQAKLIWSYNGDHAVNLFESEGAMPRARTGLGCNYLITLGGDYVYFANDDDQGYFGTSLAVVNLKTREGKTLYRTPYDMIEQLSSDGDYYYFLEYGKGETYLTAIDKNGNLKRRYEFPFDEEYIRGQEKRKIPREEWGIGMLNLQLLVTDGRYITLVGRDSNLFENLTSWQDYNPMKWARIDNVIGIIDAEDFLSGKEVEIRQIYKRAEVYN